MPDQREVWNSIAKDWQKFRTHPRTEVSEFISNKKGLVLDLACANGRNFVKISGTIVGLDFSEKMLRYAKKKEKDTSLVLGDAALLPFADDSFDAVLFANALPSIKVNKHKKVLAEVLRVSKNGAPIFVSVWNKDQPRFAGSKKESIIPWRMKGEKYERYYYLYSKDELEALLKKYFSNVHVFDASGNIIATAKVSK